MVLADSETQGNRTQMKRGDVWNNREAEYFRQSGQGVNDGDRLKAR
jgi:hypothetical protein